ncbi:MAG: A/G-specific adenine glycosylase [Ardenticatenaceae bacterium]|nr:A/G-specific adenine glycosylase [Ardenticatenaceae bacterium]MCB8989706.1 A/G-specific adenine glycosylase [Ardenticatenaceae bacterium]MCB9002835.1 A/G-specific adenine glycosylase [Ardenticatenaceae bacterium]
MNDTFSMLLLAWWDAGHADLPWRSSHDPYAIWVSEIMLQQTQIATVIPYYERWMSHFPTIAALAAASLDEVLKLWEGLGYYGRARNLHAAAQTVMTEWGGELPQTAADLQKLKGIGRYTAGAIASIAFDEPVPVLDGNVIRVLTRLTDYDGDVTTTAVKKHLWQLAAEQVPNTRPGDYNQALMELGQQICIPAKPACLLCPLSAHCQARQRGTQLERPVKPPRKNTPHYDVVAGVIWQNGERGENGRFLIAQRPLTGLLGGLWEFPGGKQEPGESLPATLIREIQEELAIEIKVGELLTSIKHAYTHFRITLHAFHASYVTGEPQHLGVSNHAWVTVQDLNTYPFAVTDQKIIASLQAEITS